MKRFYILLMVFFAYSGSLYAQKLTAIANYHPYCTSEMIAYIEFSFLIDGKSVQYAKNKAQKYEAEVRITVDIKKQDSTVKVLDYILTSSQYEDNLREHKQDFLDIKNIDLPNGDYFLHFTFEDLNVENSKVSYIDYISIKYPKDSVSVSRITLLKNIEKSENPDPIIDKFGYTTTPIYYNYIPESMNFFYFSMEIYNTLKVIGANKNYFVRSYLVNESSRRMMTANYSSIKTYNTSNLTYYVNQLVVKNLPTGFYKLVAEVYTSDTTLIAVSKTYFEKDNPSIIDSAENYELFETKGTFVEKITDEKKLQEYVASLVPIASNAELMFIRNNLKTASKTQLSNFFYSFWYKRDQISPEQAWEKYNAQIKYLNSIYSSGNMKGYRTDRGRVFLVYGPPNSVYEAPYDSHSYPYEIWQYNQIESQSNVQFIFYNVDLVSKNYELLHSDLIGEIQDPFWKVKLVNRKTPIFNFDDKSIENYHGNSVEDDWKYLK